MEYAKDEILSLNYIEGNLQSEDEASSLIYAIKKNKLIKMIISLTIVLSLANLIVIYNFFFILSEI